MEFYKSFHIWSTASKLVLRNRDWNCLNRKWNLVSPFHLSDQKSSFTKVTPFGSLIRKWFPENRKWNYLTRKWNHFSPFQSVDQKASFQKFPDLVYIFQTSFQKQEMEEEIEPFPVIKKICLQKFHHMVSWFQNGKQEMESSKQESLPFLCRIKYLREGWQWF